MKKENGIIYDILKSEGIEYFSSLPYTDCEIRKEYLLKGKSFQSVIFFLVPYYVKKDESRNISLYAVSRDYHLYFSTLFDKIKNTEPDILGFADHSPLNEVRYAAMAELGIIGQNGLLINEKYGSFVFIGEIFSPFPSESEIKEIKYCSGCGKCRKYCPKTDICLSSLTQKKGILSDSEQKKILKNGLVWGCDTCQLVCPHNKDIPETPIDFFFKDRLSYLTYSEIEKMPDSEFNLRSYSWRGRETVMRNIKLFENEENKK